MGKISIRWLLRDEFRDTRAAGAVNGTPATPGPGTRTVVDTDVDALSVAGGEAVFINPNAAYGNPGLWYEAFAAATGRVLITEIQFNTTGICAFGWDSNLATTPVQPYWWPSAIAYGVRVGGQTLGGGPLANGDILGLAIIRRSTGLYFLSSFNGGAWTMDWINGTFATDPAFPEITSFAASMDVRWVRIPDALYLPAPLAYDTFTRANGALGSSETTGPDGQAVTARIWNNRVGTTLVAGNTASASAFAGGIAIATVDTDTADVLQGAELTRAGGDVGVVVRYADATNYVIGYHDGVNAKLDKVVAGVTTPVITAAAAYGAGNVLWVICEGTQFSLYYNNVKIGATGTINDAALQAGTEQGLYSTNVGNSQDDMLTMPRGTNGEYSALDRYSF